MKEPFEIIVFGLLIPVLMFYLGIWIGRRQVEDEKSN